VIATRRKLLYRDRQAHILSRCLHQPYHFTDWEKEVLKVCSDVESVFERPRSHQSRAVPALGYGAMGLTSYYGGIEKDDEVNRATTKLVRC
jgi:hypothetical protein